MSSTEMRWNNKRTHGNDYRHFVMQKILIEQNFPLFECSLHKDRLTCSGSITPSDYCETYRISITLPKGKPPKVKIKYPEIIPSSKIHIYSNGSLCLYDHRERPWTAQDNIHDTIIPWTAEWLIYYELYKICGKWLGPEAPHDSAPKKPQKSVRSN